MRTLAFALGLAATAGAAHAQPALRAGDARLATGIRMQYLEQGPADGPVLVMLHGFSDSSFSFSRLLPLIPPSYRAFALDLRGHGDSDRPRAGYGMNELAVDVVAFMDALAVDRFTVIGHSMGSFVAQHVASLAPDRVERLVLIGSATNGQDLVALDSIIAGLAEPVPAEFIREFQYSTVHVPLPDEFMARVMVESGKLSLHVWQAAMAGHMAHETPSGLTLPTLLLWGEKDAVFPRTQQAALLDLIPGAELKVYPETGHAVHWERPERVAADLVDFLGAGR
jgi:pimeloyl-ACP methyl ester carboxylesterase